jgi:hypothetical protein
VRLRLAATAKESDSLSFLSRGATGNEQSLQLTALGVMISRNGGGKGQAAQQEAA